MPPGVTSYEEREMEVTTNRIEINHKSDSFETSQVEVAGNTVFVRPYGKGPAILPVHGFPRTSLTWRFLAPKLAGHHSVICADLRAYGSSGIPASTDDHFPYSAMARKLVDAMAKLGFSTFTVIGHDRGGRVGYRMALDHPNNVEPLAVFDVIPILEAWSRSDNALRSDLLAVDFAVAEGTASGELSSRRTRISCGSGNTASRNRSLSEQGGNTDKRKHQQNRQNEARTDAHRFQHICMNLPFGGRNISSECLQPMGKRSCRIVNSR
jgi:pimeloyl-ACP methyl ester carboxylesterase